MTEIGGFMGIITFLYFAKLLNFYTFSATAALFLIALTKDNKAIERNLLEKQKIELNKIVNVLTIKFAVIVTIYLTITYILDKYLIHNTAIAVAITTTVLFIYYIYILLKNKKIKNKREIEKKEFKKLEIKEIEKNLDDVKHDLYLYKYKYTLDNAIDNIELKNKKIAISLAKNISKYVRNATLADSFVTQKLVEKFDIEAELDENLYKVQIKIIKKVWELYEIGEIIRVQQLLQYAKNDEEKAFIYFLAQLGSGKYTQLGARYAIFAIKNQII